MGIKDILTLLLPRALTGEVLAVTAVVAIVVVMVAVTVSFRRALGKIVGLGENSTRRYLLLRLCCWHDGFLSSCTCE